MGTLKDIKNAIKNDFNYNYISLPNDSKESKILLYWFSVSVFVQIIVSSYLIIYYTIQLSKNDQIYVVNCFIFCKIIVKIFEIIVYCINRKQIYTLNMYKICLMSKSIFCFLMMENFFQINEQYLQLEQLIMFSSDCISNISFTTNFVYYLIIMLQNLYKIQDISDFQMILQITLVYLLINVCQITFKDLLIKIISLFEYLFEFQQKKELLSLINQVRQALNVLLQILIKLDDYKNQKQEISDLCNQIIQQSDCEIFNDIEKLKIKDEYEIKQTNYNIVQIIEQIIILLKKHTNEKIKEIHIEQIYKDPYILNDKNILKSLIFNLISDLNKLQNQEITIFLKKYDQYIQVSIQQNLQIDDQCQDEYQKMQEFRQNIKNIEKLLSLIGPLQKFVYLQNQDKLCQFNFLIDIQNKSNIPKNKYKQFYNKFQKYCTYHFQQSKKKQKIIIKNDYDYLSIKSFVNKNKIEQKQLEEQQSENEQKKIELNLNQKVSNFKYTLFNRQFKDIIVFNVMFIIKQQNDHFELLQNFDNSHFENAQINIVKKFSANQAINHFKLFNSIQQFETIDMIVIDEFMENQSSICTKFVDLITDGFQHCVLTGLVQINNSEISKKFQNDGASYVLYENMPQEYIVKLINKLLLYKKWKICMGYD